jgi:two-component sensor histidine kinase
VTDPRPDDAVPASRGLWLTPGPPITSWRGVFSSDRIVIYLVVPVGMLLMMTQARLELSRARQLASTYLLMVTAMAIFGGLFELAYAAWARLISTPARRWRRLSGHAVTWLAVSLLGAHVASWIIEWIWHLPADRILERSARPGLVIGGCVVAVLVFADERRALAAHLERLAAQARLAALRAELTALQARTDPHFLFNSLNAVASLIPDDPAAAETMLERLAAVFRYALDAGRHRTVALADELSAVRTYLAVEEVRFGDRLRWRIDDEPSLRSLQVPPLCLQPLVENAIRHGVSARRGATHVELRIERAGDRVRLTVEDQPVDAPVVQTVVSHPGSGTALANLRARLALLHGEAAAVTAGPAAAGWRVVIELPLAGAAVAGADAVSDPDPDPDFDPDPDPDPDAVSDPDPDPVSDPDPDPDPDPVPDPISDPVPVSDPDLVSPPAPSSRHSS